MNILEEANEIFDNIQRVAPVVHNISNYITATDCANMTLACGGSPTMADDPEEVSRYLCRLQRLRDQYGQYRRFSRGVYASDGTEKQ